MENNIDFYELGKRFAEETYRIFEEKSKEIESKYGRAARNSFEIGYRTEGVRTYGDYDMTETLRTDEDDIGEHLKEYHYDDEGYGDYQ